MKFVCFIIIFCLFWNPSFEASFNLQSSSPKLEINNNCLEENSDHHQSSECRHSLTGTKEPTASLIQNENFPVIEEVESLLERENRKSQTLQMSQSLMKNLEKYANNHKNSPGKAQEDMILQDELNRVINLLQTGFDRLNGNSINNGEANFDKPLTKTTKNKEKSNNIPDNYAALEEMISVTKQLVNKINSQTLQHKEIPSNEELLVHQMKAYLNNRQKSTIESILEIIFNITKLFVDGFFNNIEKIALIVFFVLFFNFLCCVGTIGLIIYACKRWNVPALCLNFIAEVSNRILNIRNGLSNYYNKEREKIRQTKKKLRDQGQLYLSALKEGYKRFEQAQNEMQYKKKLAHRKKSEETKKYREDNEDWVDCSNPKRLQRKIKPNHQRSRKNTPVASFDEDEGLSSQGSEEYFYGSESLMMKTSSYQQPKQKGNQKRTKQRSFSEITEKNS